jgi:hypothetical protein
MEKIDRFALENPVRSILRARLGTTVEGRRSLSEPKVR